MQKISIYKGKPRWKEWEFWLILAFWCGSVAFIFYWQGEIVGALPVSVIYLWMLLPRRTWLVGDYLLAMGPRLLGIRKIKNIHGIRVSDSSDKLTLETTGMLKQKPLDVEIEITQSIEQERFLTQMKDHGVSIKIEAKADWQEAQRSLDVLQQSLSSYDSEAEREALYKLVGRPQLRG